MTALSATQVVTLEQGLQQLASFGTQLASSGALATPLPLLNFSVGQATQFGGVLDNALYLPALNYLDTATDPTVEGLVTALTAQPAIGSSIASSVQSDVIAFSLTLSTTATAADTLALGAGTGSLGLTLAGDVPLQVDGTFQLPLTFNLSTTDGTFFVTPTAATAGVTVQAAGLNVGVGLGSQAGLTVVGGSVNLNAQVAIGLNDPDGDGRLTPSELSGTPLTQLVTVSAQGSAAASLPLNAAVAGYESLALGTPVVVARQANLLSGGAPDLSLSFDLSGTAGAAIASEVQSLVDQVEGLGGLFAASPLLTSSLPFVGSTLAGLLPATVSGGQIFQLGSAVESYLASPGATLDGVVQAIVSAVLTNAGAGAQGGLASGPVSVSGGLVPGAKSLRLDVTLAPGYAQAFSGTLPDNPAGITGSGQGDLALGLQTGLHFVIDLSGLAGGGSLTPSDATLAVDPITATASATGLGFNVAIPLPTGSAQTLGVQAGNLDLQGQIAVATHGATVGVLSLADLASSPFTSLVTLAPTASFTASLPLDGSLDGYSTTTFGTPTLDLSAASLPQFSHPDVNLDVQLNSAAIAGALESLLTAVAGLGGSAQSSGPLASVASVIDVPLASLLENFLPADVQLQDFFDYRSLNSTTLATANLGILGTATLRQALASQAATSLGGSAQAAFLGGALRVAAGLNPATQQLTARLIFQPEYTAQTEPNFQPDLGSAASAVGLSLSGSLALAVDLNLAIDLTVGLNLAGFLAGGSFSSSDAFVSVDQLDLQASGSADLKLNASVGFLKASVDNGQLAFQAGSGFTVSAATPSLVVSLADGGFEVPALASGTSQAGPSGSSWTFAGTSGLASNGAALLAGNPAAPEGSQVAYVEGAGSLSQVVTVSTGPWSGVVRFRAAQMAGPGVNGGAQALQVLVDGTPVGTVQPDSIVFGDYASVPLTLTAGPHTLAFQGIAGAAGSGVLIDAVGLFNTQITVADLDQSGGAPVLSRLLNAAAVAAPDLTMSLPLSLNLPAGLSGLPSSVQLTITDADLTDGHLPQLDAAGLASLGSLSNFRHVSPAQMISMAASLARFLEQYAASSHLNVSVPFASATTIGQALGISDSVTRNLVNSVLTPITGSSTSGPSFQFLDDYLTQINAALEPLGGSVTPSYDAATATLTLAMSYIDPSAPALSDTLSLDASLGPVGSVDATADLSIHTSVTAGFTLGVDLSPGAVSAGSVQLAPQVQTGVPTNGQLAGDALFMLIVGTTAYPVVVSKASTQGNQSINDLAADVQSALGQAGITQVNVAVNSAEISGATYQFLSFAPQTGASGGLLTDFLRIETTSTDPTATQLGFVSGQQTLGRSATLFLDDANLSAAVTLQAGFDATANLGPLGLSGQGSIGGTFGVALGLGDFSGTVSGTRIDLSKLLSNLAEFTVRGVGLTSSNGSNFQVQFPALPAGATSDPLSGVVAGMSVSGGGLPEGLRVATIDTVLRVVSLAGKVSGGLTLNLAPGNSGVSVSFSALENIALAPAFTSALSFSIDSIQLAGGDLPGFSLPSPGQITVGVPNLKAAFGSFFPTDANGNPLTSGVLDHDFQFQFRIGSGSATTVTVPKETTTSNRSLSDLVSSLNSSFNTQKLGGSLKAIHQLWPLTGLNLTIPAGALSIQLPAGTDVSGISIGHLVTGAGLPAGLTVTGIDLANLRVSFNKALPALSGLTSLSFEGISFGAGSAVAPGASPALDGLTQVFTSGLDSLAGFRDLSFAEILNGLDQVAIALGNTSSFSFLNQPLPLIGKSVLDLLNPGALLGQSSSSLNPNKTAPRAVGSEALTFDPNGPQQFVSLPDNLISSLVGATATVPLLLDGGFEHPALNAGSFQYGPSGIHWIFSGGAGVSTSNSGFTSGNPAPPQGLQVAFVQGGGSLSQSVSGFESNASYILSFQAAQRGNDGPVIPNQQNFQISIDNQVIGQFQPTSTSFATFVTQPFTVSAGTHTLTIQGLDSAGGDNTVFLDDLTLSAVGGVLFGYQMGEPLADGVGHWNPPLYIGVDGRLNGGIYGTAGAYGLAGPFVADGQWHHAAFVQQGPQQQLYLDGQLVATTSITPQLYDGPNQIGTGYTTFWPDGLGGWSTFSGQMEEARVWSVARSQAQIQSLMNGFATGAESDLEYWTGSKFDTTSVPTLGSGGQAVAENPGFKAPTFQFDPTTLILQMTVGYVAAPTPNPQSLPLNIDLKQLAASVTGGLPPALSGFSQLLDVSGSTLLQLALNASLNLHLGFDLSNPLNPEMFFYSDTGVSITGSLTADDLQFRVQAGPLAFGIGNGSGVAGSAELNFTGSMNLSDKTLSPPGATAPPTRIDRQNVGITDSISGSASASLPVFLDDSLPQLTPNLSVTVPDLSSLAQGQSGSVSIVTPNLNQMSSILDLLLNPSLLVTGMSGVFNGLQGFLDSNLISQSLPFVGPALRSASVQGSGLSARIFDSVFGNNVTTALQDYITQETKNPPTTSQLQTALTTAVGGLTTAYGTVSSSATTTLNMTGTTTNGGPVSGSTTLELPYAIPETYTASWSGYGFIETLTITPATGNPQPLDLGHMNQSISLPGLANVKSATINGTAAVASGYTASATVTVTAPDYTYPQYTTALTALTSSVTNDLYSGGLYPYNFQTDTFGLGLLVVTLSAQVVTDKTGFDTALASFQSAYMAASKDLGTLKQWLSTYVTNLTGIAGLPSSVQSDLQQFQSALLNNPLTTDGLAVSNAVVTALAQLSADVPQVPSAQQAAFQATLDSLGNLTQLYARATVNSLDASQSSTLSDFLQTVFDLFGPKNSEQTNKGLGILLDPQTRTPYKYDASGQILNGSGVVVTLADAVPLSLPNNNGIEFDLLLGQNLSMTLASSPLDLSLPGLGLNLGSTQIDVGMDWTLAFGFGLSLSEGFYLVTGTGPELNAQFTIGVDQGQTLDAQLGYLNASATVNEAGFTANFSLDLTDTDPKGVPGWLAATDLIHGDVGVVASLSGQANLDLPLQLQLGSGANFPSYFAELVMAWGYSGDTAIAGGPDQISNFKFTNVGLELGDYAANFLFPIVQKMHDAVNVGPVSDFLKLIQQRIPVISDLAGEDVTLMSLAQTFGTLDPATAQFIADVDTINSLYSQLSSMISDNSLGVYKIDFGDIDLSGAGFSIQKLHTGSVSLPSLHYRISRPALSFSSQLSGAGSSNAASVVKQFNTVHGSLSLPILNDPTSAFGILMGQNVTLFGYTMPALQFNFSYTQQFPISPPLYANLSGSLSAKAQFAFGYDTYGLTEYAQGGFSNPVDIFDGFFLNTSQSYIQLGGTIDAGADINMALASAGVDGGINTQITLGLADPAGDGKLRYKNIVAIIDGRGGSSADDFLNLFGFDGSVTASLYAYLDVDIGFTILGHHYWLVHYNQSWDIVDPITLWSYSSGASTQSVAAAVAMAEAPTGPAADVARVAIAGTRRPARIGSSLGQLDAGVLRLNVGPRARYLTPGRSQDGDESVTISHLDGAEGSETLLVTGMGTTQVFSGVGSIVADFGLGTDNLVVESGVLAAVDVKGGRGQKSFVVDGSGPARLEAGSGNDTLIGGNGTTTFVGGTGHAVIVSRGTGDLVRLGSGTYEVTGNAGTVVEFRERHTVDLSDAALIIDQQTSTLSGVGTVRMLGNDATSTVRIHDWSGHAVLDSGDGEMRLDVALGGGGQVDLQGANGHHHVQVRTAAGSAVVRVSPVGIVQGADQVRFLNGDRVSLKLIQAAGSGKVRVDDLPGPSAKLVTGAGADLVTVRALTAGSHLTINSTTTAPIVRVFGPLAARSSVVVAGESPATVRARLPGALDGTILLKSPGSSVTVGVGGDLRGSIAATGSGASAQGRVGGSVTSTGSLHASTFGHLQVGGDLAGTVRSTGALQDLTIGGDLKGKVRVAGPVETVQIGGSLTGAVEAATIGRLDVGGTLLGSVTATRAETVRIDGKQAGHLAVDRLGSLTIAGSSRTPIAARRIGDLFVGGNLIGAIDVRERLDRVEVGRAAPRPIRAGDVGMVVVHNATGPRLLKVIEAGVTRTVLAQVLRPGGVAPSYEAVYDSTDRGTPQVSLRVKNPTAAAFDLQLTASPGASVDLGRLDATERSGLRNLFVQGDIHGGLTEGARVALQLPMGMSGGVQLPGERVGAVEVHGRLGAGVLRVQGLEQLALEEFTSYRGRIFPADLVSTLYARFAVASGTRFLKSTGTIPVQPGLRPLVVLSSTRDLPAAVPNQRLVIPAR